MLLDPTYQPPCRDDESEMGSYSCVELASYGWCEHYKWIKDRCQVTCPASCPYIDHAAYKEVTHGAMCNYVTSKYNGEACVNQ